MRKRTIYAWGVAILCFVVLMIVTPAIPQSQEYHDFADQRQFFGVAAVAFGSSYYHLKPNDARLVWDRLPMTIAFTSIMAIFIIERIDERKGTISIMPLLLAGLLSILYWRYFDDLRPYALVQFVPCIAIPVMAILLPPMYTHSTYWLWAAGFYLLAKVEEAGDKVIYGWMHHIVSGHTLKHLCAAMVPVFLTLMLAKRTIETESQWLPSLSATIVGEGCNTGLGTASDRWHLSFQVTPEELHSPYETKGPTSSSAPLFLIPASDFTSCQPDFITSFE
ncbi:Senescence associated protein [Parasponia andersonii]|uniref:Senescence associated protein n=1 Tax=Parasponia andersonii TaxID=3476 RepID=A0A2P5D575_PARAD|nr:Senescence associated protein [Parasponia andersonii]